MPLLVLRLPQFERIAWREGKRAALKLERRATQAFVQAARQCLRGPDRLAHDCNSDVFVAAILAKPRDDPAGSERMPSVLDARSALERIASRMALATNLAIETGWTMLRDVDPLVDLSAEITVALERGLRERERYEFFATVGHELRTPLTSIRGYLETLIDDDMDRGTAERFLQTARRETLRLGRLIENMFEFSLLDLSAGALTQTRCDICRTVQSACDVVGPLAQSRGITIHNRITLPIQIGLNADACLQALINLLDNAIKYGKDCGSVGITANLDLPFVRIHIDDDGPGLHAVDRDKIFDLRVRGSEPARPGTGIGLAIVRMIAERAGGQVQCMESPLGGARFTLLLPAGAESMAPVS